MPDQMNLNHVGLKNKKNEIYLFIWDLNNLLNVNIYSLADKVISFE